MEFITPTQTQTNNSIDTAKIQSLKNKLFNKEEEIQNFKNTLIILNIFKSIRKETKPDKGNKETIYTSIKRDPNKLPLRYSTSTIPRRSSIYFSAVPEEYNNDDDKDAPR